MWTSTQRSESGPRSGRPGDRQQVGRSGDEPVGVLDLVPPGGQGLRHDRWIGHRAVEVPVRLLDGQVDQRHILAGQTATEPVPLDVRQVPNEAKQ